MSPDTRGLIAVVLAVGLAVPLAGAAGPVAPDPSPLDPSPLDPSPLELSPLDPSPPELSPLRLSEDGRSFVVDGEPFFWLGDAPRTPLTDRDRLDVERYLDERAEQGTTVVRTSIGDGPNAYGDVPGEIPAVTPGVDPADPEAYDFWDHASYVVDAAAERGIRVALAPGAGGPGYGAFLGGRFGDDDVVWVLDADGADDLARGIAIGATGVEDYSDLLMTTDTPQSTDPDWLSFVLDPGEPCATEAVAGPAGLLLSGGPRDCDDDTAPIDVRRSAYAAVFDGAAGHTVDAARAGEGAAQLAHLRGLMESRPFLTREVELLSDGTRVLRDSGHLMVYAPTGDGFRLDTTGLSGDRLRGWWFDPRTGTPIDIGTVLRGEAVSLFPPTTGPEDEGLDWVLVVDDAARAFPLPGS